MWRWLLTLYLLSGGVGFAQTDQHPACLDPGLDGTRYPTEFLYAVASSCQAEEVANLFYNRALHRQLLEKYQRFERSLLHFGNRDHLSYIESYRIYIGLAEAFSQRLIDRGDPAAVRRLNRVYEQSGEIAEMRFRGYDLIADRLERKLRL